MVFFKLLSALAAATLVMDPVAQENASRARLRAQLALAAPRTRLAGQVARIFAADRQMFRDGTHRPALMQH